jgi:branched-chain amino acid transport system ATP-binding protein
MADSAYLELRGLRVSYGNVEALHGISLSVGRGEAVALLGANGAGKTTTLSAISGLLRPSAGEIFFEGRPLHALPSHEIVRLGITQAPEGRRIFGLLSVRENLELGAFTRRDRAGIAATMDWIFELFPRLRERLDQLAGTLSGGEQQMLSIGRALMGAPKVLLLDEPSLGLAPILARAIFQSVREVNAAGVTVILVEQNARAALKIASRGYVLEVGRVALADSAAALLQNPDVQIAYLGGGD